MKVSQFREKVIEVVIDWHGERIEVGIRPGLWSTELYSALIMAAVMQDADVIAEHKAALAESIAHWGLTDDDGKQLPVTDDLTFKLGKKTYPIPADFILRIPVAVKDRFADEGEA